MFVHPDPTIITSQRSDITLNRDYHKNWMKLQNFRILYCFVEIMAQKNTHHHHGYKNLLKSKSIPISVWTIRNMCNVFSCSLTNHGKCEYTESKINNNSRVELKQKPNSLCSEKQVSKRKRNKKKIMRFLLKLKNALCPTEKRLNQPREIIKKSRKKNSQRIIWKFNKTKCRKTNWHTDYE